MVNSINQKHWHETGVALKNLIKIEGIQKLQSLLLGILKHFNTVLDPFLVLEILEHYLTEYPAQISSHLEIFISQFKNKPLGMIYIQLI